MLKIVSLLFTWFLAFHTSCYAVWYEDFEEELKKNIQQKLKDKSAQEQYDAGVRSRNGDKLFHDSEERYSLNSLSSVIAAKICFENALKTHTLKDELYYKLLHNSAMISLRLFEFNESLTLFEQAKSKIRNSEGALKIIDDIKIEFQLDLYIDLYKEEMISFQLFSRKQLTPIKVTKDEAKSFKFTETELKDLFSVAQKVQKLTSQSKEAVVLSLGRSPFWITQALLQFSTVQVIPLSFSLSRQKGVGSLPWSERQLIGYMRYLKNKLKEISSKQDVYVLDFVGTGQSAADFCNILQGSFLDRRGEVSILEGRTHLIGLRNSEIKPFCELESPSNPFFKHYTSVHFIELPCSLRFLLSNKSPYYKFLFLPYMAFYPQDWEREEPPAFGALETAIPDLLREQIQSFAIHSKTKVGNTF